MTVESATYLNDLNSLLPSGADIKSEGDNHIVLIKAVLKATFPNLAGRVFRSLAAKTSNYALTVSDNLVIVAITAPGITISTASPASVMGNGFMVVLFSISDSFTVDPNSSEKVNGFTTVTVPAGNAVLLACDGSNYTSCDLPLTGLTPAIPLDTSPIVSGSSDATKLVRLEVDGLTTGTTRVLTVPDYDSRIGNLPAGMVMDYAGATVPTGWLECDGSSLLRSTYSALFTAIGVTWGSADGTHFSLPDFRGRARIGKGTGAGLTARALAATGGEETHQLTVAELASHTHNAIILSGGGINRATSGVGTIGDGASTSAGSNTAHNTMMPFAVTMAIISY